MEDRLMTHKELPLPLHFNPETVGEVRRVAYQQIAEAARLWSKEHRIRPAHEDRFKIFLILVDVQNTFCIPDFELYVGGRSGTGAVDDNRRLCGFIYRNMDKLTRICPTMDTHQVMQIFHSIFLVDEKGEHPEPYTLISFEEIEQGVWRINPGVTESLKIDEAYGNQFLHHYAKKLKQGGKYDLTIWPYHAMLGGIGHALVSAVEEAVFFHGISRFSTPDFQLKGNHPLTENYSVISPEVVEDHQGNPVAEKNTGFMNALTSFDRLIIAGQAKSHCVAWTVENLLTDIESFDKKLAEKVYLLEDCMSPVVIPGVIDYTDQADRIFERFSNAGMHVVRSTDPVNRWPGMSL
jgi:nicotinamidase-related amidase